MAKEKMGNNSPVPVDILIIGGGGREHALAWKLAQSPQVRKIFCAPGNGGTAHEHKTQNIGIAVSEFTNLIDFARANKIALTVVGPDNPLADGIVDQFLEAKLPIFGPTKAAARLESSKAFAKQFMTQAGIPTPRFIVCSSYGEALDAVHKHTWARVVKVDGLALGKGVFVCDSEEACQIALKQIFQEKTFGPAGNKVVIEERITGEELSLLFFTDGKELVPMPACQDYKRRYEGDQGPNTGGMGAYSPVALFSQYESEINENIVTPLRHALAEGKLDFQGIIYVGIIIGTVQDSETRESNGKAPREDKKAFVLEFNARFGDPETQVLLPLLESDLYPILLACTNGTLKNGQINWLPETSCCVVATADRYPTESSEGELISFGDLPENIQIFHAATVSTVKGFTTNGGRILALTAVRPRIAEARAAAYLAVERVSFKGRDYRQDIARSAAEESLAAKREAK